MVPCCRISILAFSSLISSLVSLSCSSSFLSSCLTVLQYLTASAFPSASAFAASVPASLASASRSSILSSRAAILSSSASLQSRQRQFRLIQDSAEKAYDNVCLRNAHLCMRAAIVSTTATWCDSSPLELCHNRMLGGAECGCSTQVG